MQSDHAVFLEQTSSELERMQREARALGLLPIAYLIELTREEVFDELRRATPKPDPQTAEPPEGPNVVPIRRRNIAS